MSRPYRKGDQVEIVNPRWIKRVGYALHWQDLMAEVESDQRTEDALKVLGFTGREIPRYFLQAVAKLHVEQRRFGGNERSIHYWPIAKIGESILDFDTIPSHAYVGRVALVEAKRVAYTGTRYPGHGHGEDYENGGLEDRKAHVILRTTYGEIEACDVKLVKAAA